MNKPISTWTQTFYKLGYTLRRIWHDEPDYANNYTPLELEVLEDRQMLSGFGGDDPMGGGETGGSGDGAGEFSGGTPSPPGGDGTGGNGAASPASPGGDHSPDRFNGIGDFSNGLQLPEYWQSVLPAHYSFTSFDKINFRGTIASDTYTFSSRKDNTGPDDEGNVTLSNYEFTVTVNRQNDNYYETLTGQMTRYVLTSLDTAGRDSFQNGNTYDFSSVGKIVYTSNINYSFSQTFFGTLLNQVTIEVTENTDTLFDWTAEEHKHFSAPSAEYTTTSNASFEMKGNVHGRDFAYFRATVLPTGISFQTNGNGFQQTGARGTTYANSAGDPNIASWIVTKVSGTTKSEKGDLAGGNEGHRITLTMDGTVKKAFNSTYNFSGSGSIISVPQSLGHNGWVANATINHSLDSSSRFRNDLTNDFREEDFIINSAVIGTASSDLAGATSLGAGFIINLPDDDNVRNTNRQVTTTHSENRNSGKGTGIVRRQIRYHSDGAIHLTPTLPDTHTQDITVDRVDKSTFLSGVYLYDANGFTQKRDKLMTDKTTTGTIQATVQDEVTYKSNQVGYNHKLHSTGKVTTTGVHDLNSDTTTTFDSYLHQEHLISLSGSLVLATRNSGGASAGSGPSEGGDANQTGPPAGGSGSGDSSGSDELPPPSGVPMKFIDRRTETNFLKLITKDSLDVTLSVVEDLQPDGSVQINDTTVTELNSVFQLGSLSVQDKKRWHDPVADSDPNNWTAGYSHEHHDKTILGNSKLTETNELTWTITPKTNGQDSSQSSGDDDVTATAQGNGQLTPNDAAFDVTTTGTITEVNNQTLIIARISHGSQWLEQITITPGSVPETTTLYTSGSWTGFGTITDTGNATTITEYVTDEKFKITNRGSSSHFELSHKTLTTTSNKGTSSGDIPEGSFDPHDKTPMTIAGAIAEIDLWKTKIRENVPGSVIDRELGDINSERDRFSGSFHLERNFETATQSINSLDIGSTSYDFTTTYTKKPLTNSNGGDDALLAEPSVATGTAAANAAKELWNQYDVNMDGHLTEKNYAWIKTDATEHFVIKLMVDQKQGNHTAELPPSVLNDLANNAMPEFLNRNQVRSIGIEINRYLVDTTSAVTIDNNLTTFKLDGTATKETLPSGSPNGAAVLDSSPVESPLFHRFSKETRIAKSQFEQEAIWMDSIDFGYGYFSLATSDLSPIGDSPSATNKETVEITRDLKVVESLGAYFGIDSAAPSSQSGSGDSTSTPPADSTSNPASNGTSTNIPSASDGTLTGSFKMATTNDRISDFKWEQNDFSRYSDILHSNIRKNVTKIGDMAKNSEANTSIYNATFEDDGRTEYNTTTTNKSNAEWHNRTFGKTVVQPRSRGSTTTEFTSKFDGTYENETKDIEKDDGQDVTNNAGKEMSKETKANANTTGVATQTTTIQSIAQQTPYMENQIAGKVIVETWAETVKGDKYDKIDLLNPGSNENIYTGGILLTRETKMRSTLTFTILPISVQESPAKEEKKHWGANFQVSELKTFAYGSTDDPVEYHSIVKTLVTRVMGVVKLVFGIAEVAIGVGMVKSVLGAPFGVLAIIHGLDTIYAGAMQVASGEETRTLTARMADSVFMSKFKPATKDEEAKLQGFGDALDLLGGLAGGAGKVSQKLGKAVQVYKLTAGACDKLSTVGRAVKSYQEAGKIMAGVSDMRSSVRNILDNYCFVGEVDVTAYATENQWATAMAKAEMPLADAPADAPMSLTADSAQRWFIAGVGALVLLQAISVGIAKRRIEDDHEEATEAWPEFASA